MNGYTIIHPAQGCDGRWYVAADGSDNFSPTHLEMEREWGLREVRIVRCVEDEAEIRPGELVSLGNRVSVWAEAPDA